MDLTYGIEASRASIRKCNCYKSSELRDSILDSAWTANFKDRYVLGDQLGLGRFGIIRECSDKLTGEVLACKSISKERLVTAEDVRGVKLEIEILTKLSGHENVVDLKAVYEDKSYVHLLMELCAGGELFNWIEKRGRLPEHEAHGVFKQLMEVIAYCHDKGVVHRDLKPENILLVSKASTSPIKLADFGLATHIQRGEALRGTVGSPFYIAPEVLAGDYNQAADVWSAGVILYILLSGIPPFWGKTKSLIFDAVRVANLRFHSDPWDRISASAKDLISGMLCLDPLKRLTTAQVLAHTWTRDTYHSTDELRGQGILECPEMDVGGCSFSNLIVSRDRDISFGNGSPISVNSEQERSPVFSCRTSFSSTMVNGTPFSLPSFTFFSPMLTVEPNDGSLHFKNSMSSIDGDSPIGKLILSPEREQCPLDCKIDDKSEVRSKSRRNNTIGIGELDHLDVIATAGSVSRWASCTQIPSLRSSLVC